MQGLEDVSLHSRATILFDTINALLGKLNALLGELNTFLGRLVALFYKKAFTLRRFLKVNAL